MLKSTIEIRRADGTGEVVERRDYGATEDLCRTHRTDYYHSYEIVLPRHLTAGAYDLVLIVEDQLSGKYTSEQLGFVVR